MYVEQFGIFPFCNIDGIVNWASKKQSLKENRKRRDIHMKLVFSVPANIAGGAERVIVTLANYFASIGHEVYLVMLDSKSEFYQINEKVNQIKLNLDTDGWSQMYKYFHLIPLEIKRILKLRDTYKQIKPDIIVSFLFTTNILNLISLLGLYYPLIISERNDPSKYNVFRKIVCSLVYPFASRIVCQTNNVKNFFPKYVSRKIKVIPNPIDIKTIAEPYSGERNKKIVAIGRLIPQKNFSLLIRAFSKINDEYSKYTLHIYGDGPQREELLELVQELELGERVYFEGVRKNVFKGISNVSLFVMSSDFEGFPNVLAEAMASGIPSISTKFDSGASTELMENERNGYLTPVGDEAALTYAINTILSEPKTAELKAVRALKLRKLLSIEDIAEKWKKLFSEVT